MLKLSLLLIAVVAASAYDFKDDEFNKLLMDDLVEFGGVKVDDVEPVLTRYRRSAADDIIKCKPSYNHRHNKCCNDGRTWEKSEEFREIKRECYGSGKGRGKWNGKGKRRQQRGEGEEENATAAAAGLAAPQEIDIFNCEKMNRTKTRMICAAECIASKQGMIDSEGNFVVERIKQIIKDKYASTKWDSVVIEGIVDKCLEEVNAKHPAEESTPAATPAEGEPTQPRCNPKPASAKHCLWRQFVLNCPDELKDNSQQCQRLREKFNKGEEPVAVSADDVVSEDEEA